MKIQISLCLFVLLSSIYPCSPAHAQLGSSVKGPARIRNQYPLESLRLTLTPELAKTKPEGTLSARLSAAWSNTFNKRGGSYRVDTEHRELRAELQYSLSDRIEVRSEIPLHWRGGGVLDNLIDEFHRIFSLPRAGRNEVDDYDFQIFGSNHDLSPFEIEKDGFGVGNPVLSAKWNIFKKPTLSFSQAVALPAPSSQFGQQSVDISSGLLLGLELNPLYLHFGISYIFLSDDSYQDITYYRHQAAGFASVELPISEDLSLVGTLIMSSPTIRSVQRFPDFALYLDTGIALQLDENYRLEAVLRENPAPRFGTTDVTFLLALEFTT